MELLNDEFLQEEHIQSFYNEPGDEGDLILRNVVDFSIAESINTCNTFVSLEYLDKNINSNGSKGILLGTLVEPYSPSALSALDSKLCAYINPSDLLSEQDLSPLLAQYEQAINAFDRNALKTGDVIDGYCPRTHAWYPSIITEEDVISNKIKLHFKGWKPKFDEWVDRQSERIAIFEYSKYIELKAREMQQGLIPYYDDNKLNLFLQQQSEAPRRSVKIVLHIEEWCIDYAYANPCLWIVSTLGVWYRIAGPHSGSFLGRPAPAYASLYQSIADKYAAATCLAMCLFDILPNNPKTTFETVIKEAKVRSGEALEDAFILSNFEFFVDQLSSLSTQSFTNTPLPFAKSLFMSQLRMLGIEYTAKKVVKRKRLSESAEEEMNDVILLNTLLGHKGLNKKIKFPIDDKVFWTFQRTKGLRIPPLPLPQMSRQLSSPKDLQTWVLSVWAILVNCQPITRTPLFDIFEFETLLRFESGCHTTIRTLFVELLAYCLNARLHKKQKLSPRTNFEPLDDDSYDNTPIHTFINVFDMATGDESARLAHLRACLNTGYAWVEAMRLLIADKHHLVLPQYHDPLAELHYIINTVQREIDAVYSKLDKRSTRDKVIMMKNQELSRLSIGFTGILARIQQGFYDEVGRPVPPVYAPGNLVDVFCASLSRWLVGRVVSISLTQQAVVRIEGFTAEFEETVPCSRLRAARSFSANKDLCIVSPETLDAEVGAGGGVEAVSAAVNELIEGSQDVGDATLQQIMDVYRELYASRITQVLHASSIKASGADDLVVTENVIKGLDFIRESESELDWYARIVSQLGAKELLELSLETKVRLLFWACDEMLSVAGTKSFLESTMEGVARLDKENKLKIDAMVHEVEEEGEVQNLAFSRSGRRISQALVEDKPEPETKKSRNSSAQKLKVEQTPEDKGGELHDLFEAPVGYSRPRQDPIGTDREGSNYWVFFSDCPSIQPKLYCQRHAGKHSEWVVYSSPKDIDALVDWLNDKCRGEVALKKHILWWSSLLQGSESGEASAIQAPPTPLASAVGLDEEIDALYNISEFPVHEGDNAIGLCIRVGIDSLGFTLKAHQGIVYVATVDVTLKTSLCVGDIVLVVDNWFMESPQTLQDKVKELSLKRGVAKTCTLLVLRYKNPRLNATMTELLLADEVLLEAYYQESRGGSDSEDEEQSRIPSSLMGSLLSLLLATRSSYAVTSAWLASKYKSIPVKILDLAAQLLAMKSFHALGYAETRKALVDTFISLLTGLESSLKERGLILREAWTMNIDRLRYKWLLNTGRCKTYSQISFAASTLRDSIDWDVLRRSKTVLQLPKQWTDLVESRLRYPLQILPAETSSYIYYSQGHAQYVSNEDLPRWAEELPPPGVNIYTLVNSTLHSCGPPSDPARCFPFQLAYLQHDPASATAIVDEFRTLEALPPTSRPSAVESRELGRVVGFLKAAPEFVAFVHRVSKADFPDYDSIVKKSMCLDDIETKLDGPYTEEQLREDLALIHSNCHKYCANRYPDVVAAADKFIEYSNLLIPRIRAEIVPPEPADVSSEDDKAEAAYGAVSPEQQYKVCIRLKGSNPLFLVKKSRYDAGIELLFNLELESKVKARIVDSEGVRQRFGIVVGHKTPLFEGNFLVWNSLQVEWLDSPREVSYANPWDLFLVATEANGQPRARGRPKLYY